MDLETRKKRLKFQCWHRGFKEIDLILGTFFDQFGEGLSETEVDELETMLETPDQDLYGFIVGNRPTPLELQGPLMTRLQKLDFLEDRVWVKKDKDPS